MGYNFSLKSGDDFRLAFSNWNSVVIFVDEFDKLYSASPEIRDSCLDHFRTIKHAIAGGNSTIHSVVAIGTFGILRLNSDKDYESPFNVCDPVQNPYLTKDQVKALFEEYASNKKLEVKPDVIEDIYWQTNGMF
jgi:hypothetical protein